MILTFKSNTHCFDSTQYLVNEEGSIVYRLQSTFKDFAGYRRLVHEVYDVNDNLIAEYLNDRHYATSDITFLVDGKKLANLTLTAGFFKANISFDYNGWRIIKEGISWKKFVVVDDKGVVMYWQAHSSSYPYKIVIDIADENESLPCALIAYALQDMRHEHNK